MKRNEEMCRLFDEIFGKGSSAVFGKSSSAGQLRSSTKLQIRWTLGIICSCMAWRAIHPVNESIPVENFEALAWLTLGSASYYSGLRWLWRTLL